MAWRSGSLSRTLLANARRSPISRSIPTVPRPVAGAGVRPTPATLFGNQTAPSGRLFSSTILRNAGALAGAHLPQHNIATMGRLTSHLSVEARACCELSQGIFSRTCPDR